MGRIKYADRVAILNYCRKLLENIYARFVDLDKRDYGLFLLVITQHLYCEFYKIVHPLAGGEEYEINGIKISNYIKIPNISEMVRGIYDLRNAIAHEQTEETKLQFEDGFKNRAKLKDLLNYLKIQPILHEDLLFDITGKHYSEEDIADYKLAPLPSRRSMSPEACINMVRENRQKEQNNEQ